MSIKLVESFAVAQLRQFIRESMQWHGEQCILLQMYHVDSDLGLGPNPMRCPDCFDDEYEQCERADCNLCYGTTYLGGVRSAMRVWGVFTDKAVAETYGKLGTWAPDKREFQCEPFPELMEHDYVVRVRTWDKTGTTPTELEGYYGIQQVTRDSVRTGGRFGQWQWDVVGQRAQITELQKNSAIVQYPVLGQTFSSPTDVVFVQAAGNISNAEPTVSTFTFTQQAPLLVWTITHPLVNSTPDVSIVVNGSKIFGDVSYPAANTVTIKFQTPRAGTAVLIG